MAYQYKNYEESDAVKQYRQQLDQIQQQRPGEYQSKWQQQMDGLLSQYQNRKPFQYDINDDAMYQQMVDRYVQQGQQAMMDTMGQSAALTGGYGNSYAQTAGQQTYQNYLQGVNDMLPQYYQMALDRYKNEGDSLLNQYNLMANQEDMAYSRYNDQLNRYFADLDRAQSVYDNERNTDYNLWADQDERDYSRYQDQQKLAQAQVDYLLSVGVDPNAELLAMAGYDSQYVDQLLGKNMPMIFAGGGSGGTTKKTTYKSNTTDKSGVPSLREITKAVNSAVTGEVKNVGGALSAIEKLKEAGVVTDSQASILKQNVKNNASGAYIKSAPTEDELRRMHN
jgi:hypothetical protein